MMKIIGDKERFKNILERGLSILTLLAVPAAAAGAILAGEIITLLYGGGYANAVGSFRLMCLTFPPLFLAPMFGNVLFSLRKELKLLTYVILGIAGNFLFNLFLIPRLGIEGAALSTVINQIIITLYLIFLLKKEFHFSLFRQLDKIIFSTVLMAVIIFVLRFVGVNIYLIAAFGLAAYFLSLYYLKEESLDEVVSGLKRALKKKPSA